MKIAVWNAVLMMVVVVAGCSFATNAVKQAALSAVVEEVMPRGYVIGNTEETGGNAGGMKGDTSGNGPVIELGQVPSLLAIALWCGGTGPRILGDFLVWNRSRKSRESILSVDSDTI